MADLCADRGICCEIGLLSKLVGDWVLVTQVREGAPPGVLVLDPQADRRNSERADRGGRHRAPPSATASCGAIVSDNLRRALMAFPDEDVLVGTRMVDPGAFEAYQVMVDIVPVRPQGVGEERAWGRRLAKRFEVDAERATTSTPCVTGDGAAPLVLDHEPLAGEGRPGRRRAVHPSRDRSGDCLITFGWVMAEAPQVQRVTRSRPRPCQPPTLPTPAGRAAFPGPRVRACAATSSPTRSPTTSSTGSWLQRSGPRRPATPTLDLVVLTGADTARHWDVTLPADRRLGFPLARVDAGAGARRVIVDPAAYVERYFPPDKARYSGLGDGAEAWPVPFWFVDGGAAVRARAAGRRVRRPGGVAVRCPGHEAVRRALRVPAGRRVVATVALGLPRREADSRHPVARRGRPGPGRRIHRGGWGWTGSGSVGLASPFDWGQVRFTTFRLRAERETAPMMQRFWSRLAVNLGKRAVIVTTGAGRLHDPGRHRHHLPRVRHRPGFSYLERRIRSTRTTSSTRSCSVAKRCCRSSRWTRATPSMSCSLRSFATFQSVTEEIGDRGASGVISGAAPWVSRPIS